MKIYISEELNRALNTAPTGSIVLGTINTEYNVATVTGVTPPSNDVEICRNYSRTVLAVLGDKSGSFPFSVKTGEYTTWKNQQGVTVDIETYTMADFFKRTPFDSEILAHLQSKRVLMIGIGSVGAMMGVGLAKAGVGELSAVDKDILEVHNCMRHVLGTEYTGWPKPVAFAHHLREQVPTAQCRPVFGDVFEGDRSALHRLIEETRPTHILATTDSLHVQYLCQLTAIHYQIPLMTVACDSNAVEGEIFFWEPGQAEQWRPGRPKRGCYGCMRDPNTLTIERSAHFDYSNDDPGSYGGEPALGTFINRINNIAAIFMTAWLLRDAPTRGKLASILDKPYDGQGLQYVRLGGPYPFEAEGQVTAKNSWGVEWYRVLKREECPFCGKEADVKAALFPEVISDDEQPDSLDGFEPA